jgi:hypothetical protein
MDRGRQKDRRNPSICRLLRFSKAFLLQERVRSLMQQPSRAHDFVTDNQLHERVAEPAAIGRYRSMIVVVREAAIPTALDGARISPKRDALSGRCCSCAHGRDHGTACGRPLEAGMATHYMSRDLLALGHPI